MKLNLQDNNGKDLQIGDIVEIIEIIDDSGNATDIYGVEPHLDGWVHIMYIQKTHGTIFYNKDLLMYQILDGKRGIPLSSIIRGDRNYRLFDSLTEEDKKDSEIGIENITPEIITDYLIKL